MLPGGETKTSRANLGLRAYTQVVLRPLEWSPVCVCLCLGSAGSLERLPLQVKVRKVMEEGNAHHFLLPACAGTPE